ncbi:VOC family protein [Mycolicibacterium peregrinum]|uniref:VOC family protein n=1 Tax=Mycolicibacterium peregrinum TaxID=43304 RepID=UPI003AAAD6BC
MAITTSSVAHVRLTVTDIERSRQFHESVFGWPVLIELPQDADVATRARLSFLSCGVIYDAGATLIGLRPVGRDAFDENRTGLDHLAFRLRSLAELTDKDIGPAYILEFRDPDNIALELTAPK